MRKADRIFKLHITHRARGCVSQAKSVKPAERSDLTDDSIPVLGALITFVLLHRRHIKRQRLEDANDRHASMDFGMGNVAQRQKKKGSNDKAMDLGGGDEKPGGGLSHRQISMDMGMSVHSPYLLPPELQNSRESLHSLSRTLHEQEDPYRPVKEYYPGDGSSMRSQSKQGSSIYTGSSHAPSRLQESGTSDLLSNAGQMGRVSPPTAAFPPRQNSLLSRTTSLSPVEPGANPFAPQPYPVEPAQAYFPGSVITRKELPNNSHPGQGSEPTSDGRRSLTSSEGEKNSGYPGTMAQPRGFSSTPSPPPEQALPADPVRKSPPPPINAYPMNAGPVRKDSIPFVQAQHAYVEDVGQYDEGFRVTPPSPTLDNAEAMRGQRYSMDVPPEQFAQAGLGAPGFDAKRLSMGFRPLPPNATSESEDPETRANRIRSFYKEYFDESKPLPQGQYYEDYDETYLGEAAYYDPDSNAFVMPAPHHPYAEPITRHAMTPPPRGPPRFQPQSQYRDRQGSMGTMSTMSGGRGPPSGPRAYSSASGRMGPPRGPKRPVPPPSDLTTLPTPSKLRDDAFALNPLDFAPPKTYRDRVAGRSESPLGERRPYSPMVPAFAPTASTFDELQPMPSP